jgi:hypothetical protein
MGIHDQQRALLDWLQRVAPHAFFYRLPDSFVPSVIVHDLTALMVAGFHSPSVKMGYDFVNYLHRPIGDFAQAASPELGAPRATCEDDVSLDAIFRQYCAHWDGPGETPTNEMIRDQWTAQDFMPRVDAARALFIMTRDNPHHTPENRAMVHDERYESGARETPFTEDEIRRQGFHIRDERPMPGILSSDPEVNERDQRPSSLISAIRRQAAATPAIREAYQTFGPWALAQMLLQPRGGAPLAEGDDARFVMIDHVMSDFPEQQYMHGELMDLQPRWSRQGPVHMELVRVRSGHRLPPLEPVKLGESDLKMVWFAEHMADDGDHVLLRCNDSDVLFVLLLHMQRWGRRRLVFIDTMPQADKRLRSRFVCLNILAEAIGSGRHGSLPRSLSCAPFVVTFVALCCGSDYTRNHYYISASAILKAFEDDGDVALLSSLIRVGEVHEDDRGHFGWDEERNEQVPSDDWPVLVLLDYQAADRFWRSLFVRRMGGAEKLRKEFGIADVRTLAWAEIGQYNTRHFAKHKQADKYKVGDALEMEANIRQIHWTLMYWANAHLGCGLFPRALGTIAEFNEASLWGWIRGPAGATQGQGKERCLTLAIDQAAFGPRTAFAAANARFQMLPPSVKSLDHVLSKVATPAAAAALTKRQPEGEEEEEEEEEEDAAATSTVRWHVCHALRVAPDSCIWNQVVAEWLIARGLASSAVDMSDAT